VGAIELGERLVGETAGSEIGPSVARLVDDIKQDRGTLEDLMDGLGISHDPVKQSLGWIGEKLSRLKLAIGSGPPELGRLLSLEALSTGVQGKLSLWQSLGSIAAGRPALAGTDFDGLVERARAQLSLLDVLRASVAPSALAVVADHPAT
jgi:hypothetical protein